MKIRTKLIFSFLIVAMLVAVVGAVGVNSANRTTGLRNVELPMEQNLREVEVSIWETIHAADAFKRTGDPYYADLYKNQTSKASKFYLKYTELTTSIEEQIIIEEFNRLWEGAKVAGEKMIALTYERRKIEKELFKFIEIADDIIEFEIKAKWSKTDPNLLAKEQTVRDVEISIWQTIHTIIQYIPSSGWQKAKETTPRDENTYIEIMFLQFNSVKEFSPKYKALANSAWEKKAIAKFDVLWSNAIQTTKTLVKINEESEKQFNLLYENLDKADGVIDLKMQTFIQKRIDNENTKARTNVYVSIIITIISLLLALVLGLYISRSISNQLNELRDAAVEISQGNMEAKINASTNNEIGEMADAFDNMRTSLKIMMEKYDKS